MEIRPSQRVIQVTIEVFERRSALHSLSTTMLNIPDFLTTISVYKKTFHLRVSLAEMQYQQQLQEALRVSLEEAQEKPAGPPPATEEVSPPLSGTFLLGKWPDG